MSTSAKFEVKLAQIDETVLIEFAGPMGEKSTFPSVDSQIRTLTIDLEMVNYVNSFGIQRWVSWIRDLHRSNPKLVVRLLKVPAFMAKNIGFVREFLPKTFTFDSVFVPVYCSECEKEGPPILVRRGDDLEALRPKKILAKAQNCKSCGGPMIPDADLAKYFWFWK
jgi:hypothetical protein